MMRSRSGRARAHQDHPRRIAHGREDGWQVYAWPRDVSRALPDLAKTPVLMTDTAFSIIGVVKDVRNQG
jgi:hypothetical protein